MTIVSDDFNVVVVGEVSAVNKPDGEGVNYLSVSLTANATPLTCRFATPEARDDFYKRLVEALEKA